MSSSANDRNLHANRLRALFRSVMGKSFRLLMTGLVLWIGWITARSFQRVVLGPQTVSPLAAAITRPDDVPPDLLDYLDSPSKQGHWSFAGWTWRVGRRWTTKSIVEERLKILAAVNVSQRPEIARQDDKIFAALERLPFEKSELAGRTTYSLSDSTVRALIVGNREADQVRLVAAAIALAGEDGRWLLLELLPHIEANPDQGAVAHLMPLLPGVRQVCARWATDGELDAEVLTVNGRPSELLANWRISGWQVRRASDALSPQGTYFCQKENRRIYAWLLARNDRLLGVILIRLAQDPAA